MNKWDSRAHKGMDSSHPLTKRWNSLAQIDCLRGTDKLNRCNAQRQPCLLIQATRTERSHGHTIFYRFRQARGRQLQGDGMGQQTRLGCKCGSTMTKHGQGILREIFTFPQSRRQTRMPAGEELLDALTRKGQGMGKSNARIVKRGRQPGSVEVPYREQSSF